MPKAAVNEYRRFVLWQDDIRAARQILAMQTEAVALPVKQTANDLLGCGVFAPNACHYFAAFCGGEYVTQRRKEVFC
jgi:hypothetical protein